MKSRFLALLAFCLATSLLHAQTSAFTYQGRLVNNGTAANGSYQFQIKVQNAASNSVGVTVTPVLGVTNGVFTVTLDWGNSVFDGSVRYLEIGVRTNGSVGAYSILSPRQEITSSPYAIQAATAGTVTGAINDSQLSSNIPRLDSSAVFSGAITFSNASGVFIGNGAGLTNVNAASLNGLPANSFWQTTGNSNTTAGNNFIGTKDNQPLEIRVNNSRAVRVEPNANGAPNLIGGSSGNKVASGISGATISGGGATNYSGQVVTNYVASDFGTIGGGRSNVIQSNSPDATVAGGNGNTIYPASAFSTIAGGQANIVNGSGTSFIGNGSQNTIQTNSGGSAIGSGAQNIINANSGYSFVGSGQNNYIMTNAPFSFIGSGYGNQVTGTGGFVGAGGYDGWILGPNSAGAGAVVGGGVANTASGLRSVVPGGANNTASAQGSFAAGQHAKATHSGSFVWADGFTTNDFGSSAPNQFLIRANGGVGINTTNTSGLALMVNGTIGATDISSTGFRVSSSRSQIIGGYVGNSINVSSLGATIAGGGNVTDGINQIGTGNYGTISGGVNNLVNSGEGVIAGGANNIVNGFAASIGGGENNRNAGDYSFIAGGFGNFVLTATAATIGGGYSNNITSGDYATIGGGLTNRASGLYSTIPGGYANVASGDYSFAAGSHAKATNSGSIVFSDAFTSTDFNSTSPNQFLIRANGGVGINKNNPSTALDVSGTITATDLSVGAFRVLSSRTQIIGGYSGNSIASGSIGATIGGGGAGGLINTVTNQNYGTIGGGVNNVLGGYSATIGGGDNNVASALYSSVIGGYHNFATGISSAILGGSNNVASAEYSLAAGRQAKATNNGAFVFSDSQAADFSSTTTNEFSIRAQNGVRVQADKGIRLHAADYPMITRDFDTFATNAPASKAGVGRWGLFLEPSRLTMGIPSNDVPNRYFQVAKYSTNGAATTLMTVDQAGNVTATGTITGTSDRNAKQNFASINPRDVLEKVAALPISRWNYKADSDVPHVGPMAQDFYAAFGVGQDDKHISMVDADGVALAAIQGLNEVVKDKDHEIRELKAKNESLEKRLSRLEDLLQQSAAALPASTSVSK